MTKKDFAKLIVETTKVATQAEILQKQINNTSSFRKDIIDTAESTLESISSAMQSETIGLDENLTDLYKHKGVLKSLSRDLKSSVAAQINTFSKQLEGVNKSLQKILDNPKLKEAKENFDATELEDQIEASQASLTSAQQSIAEVKGKVNELQGKVAKAEDQVNSLLLSQDLKKTAGQMRTLEKRMSSIERTLEKSPEYKEAYQGSLTPLRDAMKALSTHEKMFSDMSGSPSVENEVEGGGCAAKLSP